MKSFTFDGHIPRVVFGVGALDKLGAELERLGAKRALVLSTPEQRAQAEDVAKSLGALAVGVYDRAVMHTPIESVLAGRAQAQRLGADCAVAIGGGSTLGLAKAIALESALPILAIPTTYAGSEMTPIQGITEGGIKTTRRDMRMLPKTVIYDARLTLTLPVGLSMTSAMNSIAHCAEALYAQEANPIVSLMAEEGIRTLSLGMPKVAKNPGDIEARGEMQYGAWLGGVSLGMVGMALHHKLCHTLGGSFNLPHAQTHTVVLPHAIAYNTPAAEQAMARISKALGLRGPADAACGLYDLAKSNGAPVALKDIGMKENDLDRATEIAVKSPYWNPRAIEPQAIRKLLDDAYFGRRPG
jgi:maleylacetate reductase